MEVNTLTLKSQATLEGARERALAFRVCRPHPPARLKPSAARGGRVRTRTAYRLVFGIFAVLLVLAVPMALTGSDEDRRSALGLLFAAAVVAGFWWLDREFRVKPRRMASEDAGARLGLRPSGDDGWVRAIGFDLLRPRGTLQDVTNVLEGTWNGEPVATFEFRWANEDLERRYSCALVRVPATWPRLAIERETGLTRLARDAGIADVQTEWEEFNRAFRVWSADTRFATAVLDGRMMEWLMARPPGDGFEIAGGWVLASTTQVQPWEVESVIRTALAFRERISSVVHSLFPSEAAPPRPDEPAP